MKKRLRWFLFLIVPATALTGLFYLPDLQFRKLANEYPQALADAKAAGIPTRVEDFSPAPIPDEENAAIELQIAMSLEIQGRPNYRSRLAQMMNAVDDPSLSVPAPTPEMVQIMDICRAAVKKPKCQFKRDWSDPVNTLLPEFASLKSFAKLLSADMVIKARAGQWDKVHEDAQAIQKLAEFSSSNQTFIGGLVNVAIKAINYSFLVQIVDESNAHPRIIEIIEDVCAKRQSVSPTQILYGEAYLVAYVSQFAADPKRHKEFEDEFANSMGFTDEFFTTTPTTPLDRMKALVPKNMKKFLRLRSHTVRRAQATKLLQIMTEIYQPIFENDLNWEESAQYLKIVEQFETQEQKTEDELAASMLPSLAQAGGAFRATEMQVVLLRTAMEIHRYRAAKGQFPKAGDIVLPIDPFSGKDLILDSYQNGFRLYSVGANGIDDGGIHRDPTTGNYLDMVYQFRMPDTLFGGR